MKPGNKDFYGFFGRCAVFSLFSKGVIFKVPVFVLGALYKFTIGWDESSFVKAAGSQCKKM